MTSYLGRAEGRDGSQATRELSSLGAGSNPLDRPVRGIDEYELSTTRSLAETEAEELADVWPCVSTSAQFRRIQA
jgi:hypothetical protein